MRSDRRDARLVETVGRECLDVLHQSKVAVIGAGALGWGLVQHLGLLGVGLRIVDCGRVEPPNLGNQGFSVAQLGERKADARVAQIRAQNPDCDARAWNATVESLGMGRFADLDAIVTGLDSRRSRMHVNALSVRLGVPWVDAAVDGSGQSFGTITTYDPRVAGASCYACPRDEAGLAEIAREARGPGCPSWRAAAPVTPPTLVASAFAAVVSALQSIVAVRVLLGQADALRDARLLVGADGVPRVRRIDLSRNERCRHPHDRLEPLLEIGCAGPGELLARARRDLAEEPIALRLHGRPIASGLLCPRCSHEDGTLRVAAALRDEEIGCPVCRAPDRTPIERAPAALVDRLEGHDLDRAQKRTWTELGLPELDVVTAVSAAGRVAHYIVVNTAGDDPAHGTGEK